MESSCAVKKEKSESLFYNQIDEATNKSVDYQPALVTLGYPQTAFQMALPLNSPLTAGVFLPQGTILFVSDSSTLKIIRAKSSQNSPTAEENKLSSPVTLIPGSSTIPVAYPSAGAVRLEQSYNDPTTNEYFETWEHLPPSPCARPYSKNQESQESPYLKFIPDNSQPAYASLWNGIEWNGTHSPTSGLTIASFAKMKDAEAVVDSNTDVHISTNTTKICPLALSEMPPLIPIVPDEEPSPVTQLPYPDGHLDSNRAANADANPPVTEPSLVAGLETSNNGSVQGDTVVLENSPIESNKERLHPVLQFFTYNTRSGRSECNVVGCSTSRKGKHPTILINHLRLKHRKKEYVELMSKWTSQWAQPKSLLTMQMLQNSKVKRVGKKAKQVPSSRDTKEDYAVPTTSPMLTRSATYQSQSGTTSNVLPANCPSSGENYTLASNFCETVFGDGADGSGKPPIAQKKVLYGRLHPVYRYFTYHKRNECSPGIIHNASIKSECSVGGCGCLIMGNNPANLIFHLKLKHSNTKEYQEFVSLNNEYEEQRQKSVTNVSIIQSNLTPRPEDTTKRPATQIGDETACKNYFLVRKQQRFFLYRAVVSGTTATEKKDMKSVDQRNVFGQRISPKIISRASNIIRTSNMEFVSHQQAPVTPTPDL